MAVHEDRWRWRRVGFGRTGVGGCLTFSLPASPTCAALWWNLHVHCMLHTRHSFLPPVLCFWMLRIKKKCCFEIFLFNGVISFCVLVLWYGTLASLSIHMNSSRITCFDYPIAVTRLWAQDGHFEPQKDIISRLSRAVGYWKEENRGLLFSCITWSTC